MKRAVCQISESELFGSLQEGSICAPYQSLRDGVFAHPTLAESLNNLFASPEE
jgi:hypothetical protein